MNRSIPTTIGMLSLSIMGTGCGSDAKKVANTLEKICKDQCDCPESLEQWNEISNCKKACAGYALQYEASLEEDHYNVQACKALDSILQEIEDCNIGICGYDYNPGCDYTVYYRLNECWPTNSYNPNNPYSPYGSTSEPERLEMLRMLMHPIPVATISDDTLHQASAAE